jgi:hypothetical protein
MVQAWDVLLDGQGYMVAPGSYRRGMDAAGGLGGPPVRQVQREWMGGGLRALQAERDRFWSSLGVLPVGRGQGVGPGPKETQMALVGLHATARRYGVINGGRPYFAAGGNLWRPNRAGAGLYPNNLGGSTQLGVTLAQDCTGLATDGGDRLFLSRSGAAFAIWTVGGAAFDTSPTVPLVGCAWYAGSLWGGLFDGTTWRLVRCISNTAYEGTGWPLDSAPRAFATVRDGLYIGTGGGLWRARGSVAGGVFSGEVAPLVVAAGATADDFVALADYNGELYTWANGEVVRYHVTASGGAALLPTGLRGWGCRGLAVAGGYLFAAIVDGPAGSGAGLWAYDGSGWWCLGRNFDGVHEYCWPLASAGYFDNADLIAFANGTSYLYAEQLRGRTTQPGLAASGELVTSLWHGRDPDKTKSWSRVGAELAWPDGATFGACTVALAYSTDGGATFASAGSASSASAAARTLAYDLPSNTVGKWLTLKYSLTGVTDGAPTLAALWAEYRTVEVPQRRRHWTFDLLVADGTVGRAGVPDARRGAAIAADLWAAWEGSATLTFRDIDYDLAPVGRNVRIVALEEAVAAPADAGRWGESRVRVQLVEV